MIFSRTIQPISTKVGLKASLCKGTQIFTNKEPFSSEKGDNEYFFFISVMVLIVAIFAWMWLELFLRWMMWPMWFLFVLNHLYLCSNFFYCQKMFLWQAMWPIDLLILFVFFICTFDFPVAAYLRSWTNRCRWSPSHGVFYRDSL